MRALYSVKFPDRTLDSHTGPILRLGVTISPVRHLLLSPLTCTSPLGGMPTSLSRWAQEIESQSDMEC